MGLERDTESGPSHPSDAPHDNLIEGEEPPPPGAKAMAVVRWAILGLSAVLAVGTWWSYASADRAGAGGATQVAPKYHCSMHPQIVSNDPGECPICHMTLEPIASNRATVPAAASAGSAVTGSPDKRSSRPDVRKAASGSGATPPAPGTTPPGTVPIALTLDRIQAIGVRTALVTDGGTSQKVRVTAIVAPAEQGVAEVHVRTPGFVERLHVSQTGTSVARQQALFAFYSPEIFQAQSELLTAQKWAGEGAAPMGPDASRRKLELLGMSPKDIDEVVRSGEPMRAIPIYAPQSGFVTKKNIVAGSYVTPEMALYEIQDLSRVYVVADVFQQDIGSLRIGTAGRFVPTRSPDQAVDVRVDLVYPTVNAEARTTRVRASVRNAKGTTFRPGEFGTVEFAAAARKVLTVPRDAVIDTGLTTYVFVVEGEGRFSPRVVALGEEQGDSIVVRAGLSPGERVVSGATFLIDSESRLQASAAQTASSQPPATSRSSDAPSCEADFDRSKYPDKWIECQKCVQVHRGMGSMEADCKSAIPRPWK